MLTLAAETTRDPSVVPWVIIGLTYVLIAVLFFAFFIAPIWALIEAAFTDREAWQAIGRDKTGWILAILFGSILGAGIYWFKVRPQLRQAKKQGRHTQSGASRVAT